MMKMVMDKRLRNLFEAEGLLRTRLLAEPDGSVIEEERAPLVLLGPNDDDAYLAPSPTMASYPGKSLAQMTLDDYHVFLYRWFEAAARSGDLGCVYCGKTLCADDDLPDEETWDAFLIEKELVAWMAAHFDCKRWIAKKLKGMHPFELPAREPPIYDLSTLDPALTERPTYAEEEDLN
jgi:hypothetical protein